MGCQEGAFIFIRARQPSSLSEIYIADLCFGCAFQYVVAPFALSEAITTFN